MGDVNALSGQLQLACFRCGKFDHKGISVHTCLLSTTSAGRLDTYEGLAGQESPRTQGREETASLTREQVVEELEAEVKDGSLWGRWRFR